MPKHKLEQAEREGFGDFQLQPDQLKEKRAALQTFEVRVPKRNDPSKEMTFLITAREGGLTSREVQKRLQSGEGLEGFEYAVVEKGKGKIYRLGEKGAGKETVLTYIGDNAPKIAEVRIKKRDASKSAQKPEVQKPAQTAKPAVEKAAQETVIAPPAAKKANEKAFVVEGKPLGILRGRKGDVEAGSTEQAIMKPVSVAYSIKGKEMGKLDALHGDYAVEGEPKEFLARADKKKPKDQP